MRLCDFQTLGADRHACRRCGAIVRSARSTIYRRCDDPGVDDLPDPIPQRLAACLSCDQHTPELGCRMLASGCALARAWYWAVRGVGRRTCPRGRWGVVAQPAAQC